MKIRKVILFSVILALLLLLFSLPWNKYNTIDKLNIDNNNKLEILSERDWEVTIGIYCRIAKEQESQPTDVSLVGFISPNTKINKLKFNLLKSKDGKLIALYESHVPEKILFICDLANGHNWSGYSDDNSELFENLEKEFPEKVLIRADMSNDGLI